MKQRRIKDRLSREEAFALIMTVLKRTRTTYDGGWNQVLADATCMDGRHIRNLIWIGRKSGEKLKVLLPNEKLEILPLSDEELEALLPNEEPETSLPED